MNFGKVTHKALQTVFNRSQVFNHYQLLIWGLQRLPPWAGQDGDGIMSSGLSYLLALCAQVIVSDCPDFMDSFRSLIVH